MTLNEMQQCVDLWIKKIGGGYFSELTNMVLLIEEVGELARVIARTYGEQKAKPGDMKKSLEEEIADVLWVLTCISNQTGINLQTAFEKSLDKKTQRDFNRFRNSSL